MNWPTFAQIQRENWKKIEKKNNKKKRDCDAAVEPGGVMLLHWTWPAACELPISSNQRWMCPAGVSCGGLLTPDCALIDRRRNSSHGPTGFPGHFLQKAKQNSIQTCGLT